MKAIITIEFKKIKKQRVTNTMLHQEPELLRITQKTVKVLGEQIVKYFKDYDIEVEVLSEVVK
jgi:hypothetical protein